MTESLDQGPFYVGKHWQEWGVYNVLENRRTHSKWPTREQAQAACDKANANYEKRWGKR